jgi:hypothetical protein
LIVGFSILGTHGNSVEAQEFERRSEDHPRRLRWIPDRHCRRRQVTATAAKQSSAKACPAQTQLVAEELSVPLDRVTLIYCDTALTPDQGVLRQSIQPG